MFYRRWLAWCAGGVALALLLARAYALTAPNLLFANIIVVVMIVAVFPLCFFAVALTNFGFGSSWRDGGRIQPVKRPSVGFAAGYCIAVVFVVARYLTAGARPQ